MKYLRAILGLTFFITVGTGQLVPCTGAERFACPLSSVQAGMCFGEADVCDGVVLQIPTLCGVTPGDSATLTAVFGCFGGFFIGQCPAGPAATTLFIADICNDALLEPSCLLEEEQLLCPSCITDCIDQNREQCSDDLNCGDCIEGYEEDASLDCVAVDCGTLDDIDNGGVVMSTSTFGSTATYTCEEGYDLSDEVERTCQADGSWDGDEPDCIPVDCGTLDDIDNGGVVMSTSTFGSTATYTCEEGYDLSNDVERTCQADGSWDGDEPDCIPVDCGTLDDIDNGGVVMSTSTFGSTATYTCEEGYDLSNDVERTCQADGSWDGDEPDCIPVDCGTLLDIVNGGVDVPTSTFNSYATYTCEEGYDLIGDMARHCQADGMWSGQEPDCTPACEVLTDISGGRVTVSGVTGGSTATYRCFYGYTLNGVQERECQGGQWSEEEPTCEKVRECQELNLPKRKRRPSKKGGRG